LHNEIVIDLYLNYSKTIFRLNYSQLVDYLALPRDPEKLEDYLLLKNYSQLVDSLALPRDPGLLASLYFIPAMQLDLHPVLVSEASVAPYKTQTKDTSTSTT
jgi:hypothetical protein